MEVGTLVRSGYETRGLSLSVDIGMGYFGLTTPHRVSVSGTELPFRSRWVRILSFGRGYSVQVVIKLFCVRCR